jgi:cobalt-zinc-cadmium efflux system outer membrane protein
MHGVPTTITTPGVGPGPTEAQQGISAAAPEPISPFSIPFYGTLDLPTTAEDEGPASGLTLDMAIDISLKRNLDLRAKFYEIPQAQADILQASLRANPVFYADGQLLNWANRTFSRAAPGGPSQYDINITYPLDVSHKRQARTLVATKAKRVLEAQYQDAVRQRIDDIYGSFVDVLAARQTVLFSRESVKGLERLLARTQSLFDKQQISLSALNRVKIQYRIAQVGMFDAEASLRRAKKDLGTFLQLAPSEADALEVRGSIQDRAPPIPSVDELRNIALAVRPDVVSFRLGISRANADVRLAKANRYTDIYVLYQPFTFQDNSPYGLRGQYSWALGVTVPLPIYNRNQGGIRRAELNVRQTQIELAALERQTLTDVEKAENEYTVTRQATLEIQNTVLADARSVRDDAYRLYLAGDASIVDFINAQLDFNTILKQYLDTAIRHRRSMLALNTAVGQRVLP